MELNGVCTVVDIDSDGDVVATPKAVVIPRIKVLAAFRQSQRTAEREGFVNKGPGSARLPRPVARDCRGR